MRLSTRVKLTAYAVLGAYSVVLFFLNIHLPSLASRLLGLLPVAILGLFALLDNWLWHVGFMPRALKQPVLAGTWTGTLTSLRRDNAGQPLSTEHDVILVVRQTLTSVQLTMMTAESKSRSGAAQILTHGSDDYTVCYQYQNDPKIEVRHRSPIHPGGAQIEVGGVRPTQITGEYWTARETRGSFQLRWGSKQHAATFDAGQRLPINSQKEASR